MIHIKLNVYSTEAFLLRYSREQFYQQLSAMSSQAMKSARVGLHGQPGQASTCVSRRDRVRQLESSRKWFEISQLEIFNGKCSKVFDSKKGSYKRLETRTDYLNLSQNKSLYQVYKSVRVMYGPL